MIILPPLSTPFHLLLFFTSLALVAFGQPSTIPFLGPIAAICGFACFWRVLLDLPSAKQRFLYSTLWYTTVTLVHFSWMLSHPFKYIYAAYPLLSLFYGAQFGVTGLFITPKRASRTLFPFFIAALWTCLEWSRLWILTGSSWNPSGLLLATNPYTLQLASWVGVFGLTFWITLTNAAVLQAVSLSPHFKTRLSAFCLCAFPYLLGLSTFFYHHVNKDSKPQEALTALLVQPAFPIEEWLPIWGAREAIDFAFSEWKDILTLIAPHQNEQLDLVVLPENVVPFGANVPLFRHDEVRILFSEALGAESLTSLPPLAYPLAHPVETTGRIVWVVSHSYIAQGIANYLETGVVAGLEDRVTEEGISFSTTSAFYFTPQRAQLPYKHAERYDKRVLVPGEYIPFAWLEPFLKEYGIHSSFKPGDCAKNFLCKQVPFGLSVCYEETYGHTMRDNRCLGARFLVNLTNDGWYPRSGLSDQHFEHSRLRAVEMGIPLIRSTNTGVTASVSSLGATIDRLAENDTPSTLLTKVPLHHYSTLYSYAGDWTILCISGLSFLAYFVVYRPRKK